MSRLIELTPAALAAAVYIWSLWTLLVQFGFQNLTPMGQGLVVSILPALAGALWFIVRELEGTRRIVAVFLIVLPIIYYSALVIAALLHMF